MSNLTTTVGNMSIISSGTYRLQQLAKQAGLSMATLADALGCQELEHRKPTSKVTLQSGEAQMLRILTQQLTTERALAAMREAALRDRLDAHLEQEAQELAAYHAYCEAQLREERLARQAEEQEYDSFMQHPEFTVQTVAQALACLRDEAVEFCQQPSRDEASDICFGIGRLFGALVGRKYVPIWGDGLHLTKCQARYEEYGHFRSPRHLACSFCGRKHNADGYSTCLH